MENLERCDWCGTDPLEVGISLNRLQVLIEYKHMREIDRLRCLDLIYEIRSMMSPGTNVIQGPWGLENWKN